MFSIVVESAGVVVLAGLAATSRAASPVVFHR
jgi:hypothetical protein